VGARQLRAVALRRRAPLSSGAAGRDLPDFLIEKRDDEGVVLPLLRHLSACLVAVCC